MDTGQVRQGCPLSALLYAISTHPLLLYLDHLTSRGQLKGLQLLGAAIFVAQAYANDSFFMPQNTPQELKTLMDALSLFGLAAGLHVNFQESKLIHLKSSDWHALLWPGEILVSDALEM